MNTSLIGVFMVLRVLDLLTDVLSSWDLLGGIYLKEEMRISTIRRI